MAGSPPARPPPPAHSGSSASGAHVIIVNTGQQLADAVAEFGRTGRTTTVYLRQPVTSLANATFTELRGNEGPGGSAPYSRGTLTLEPWPGAGRAVVVDAAMRSHIAPPFGGTARLVLNRCARRWTT